MKKWALWIVITVVLLLVVALTVVFLNLNSIVEKGVETVGPQLTKVEVRLGSATLSAMNGNGELNDLFVGNPEGYKMPSAIEVKNIKVEVKLRSILSDTIVVESVTIEHPEVTFEGGLGGNNLSTILKNLEGAPDDVKPTPEGKPADEGGKKYLVKTVTINSGKIHLSVPSLSEKAMVVPLPPIHLTDIGSETGGVTAAQLCKAILKPLIASALKSGTEAIAGDKLKELDADKAVEGLKNIFRK